jgi:hypothetical protein
VDAPEDEAARKIPPAPTVEGAEYRSICSIAAALLAMFSREGVCDIVTAILLEGV